MSAINIPIENLDSWLQSQPVNTVNTPYEINVTGQPTASDISQILQSNNTKYVDLRETELSFTLNLREGFKACDTLVYAPQIPDGVIDLFGTFSFCRYLKESPVIPTSVTKMELTFSGCISLLSAPVIPSSVTTLFKAFSDCTSLTTPPVIPNSVVNLQETFWGCSSLTSVPIIPNSVTNMNGTFSGCSLITETPVLPNSISYYNMDSTFYNCISLRIIHNIPTSIRTLSSTFEGCTSLVSVPDIPSNVIAMENAFRGCTSLERTPVIPISVIELQHAFDGCSSLESVIFESFNDSAQTISSGVFSDCDSLLNFYSSCPYEVKSFLQSLSASDLPNNFDINDCHFYLYPEEGPVLIPISKLGNELNALDSNTNITPYNITVTELTNNNFNNLNTALTGNTTKFVNLKTTQIPIEITDLSNSFESCSNLVVSPSISENILDLTETFKNCSNLEEIPLFEVPLSVLENNAADCFYGCSSLTSVGIPAPVIEEADEWHIFLLDIGADSISGRVYDNEGNYETIPSTQITKDKLTLPIMTDELLFTSQTSVSDLIELIEDVIENGYSYFSGICISPDNKSMVLYADDPNNFVTNIPMGSGSGIEVYPTEEDLEQDLPNKNVGDLVGTYGNDLDVLADDKAIIINSSMISYSGGVCTIALNSGIPVTGGIYKLYFGEGILDSNAITSILITSGGVQGNLITKNGNVASHSVSEFTHNGVSVAPTNLAIDWYTVLEVMWNGSDWLVIGNPEVASYKGPDKNFVIYADGFIEQWGFSSYNINNYVLTFNVPFINTPCLTFISDNNTTDLGTSSTSPQSFQLSNTGCTISQAKIAVRRLVWSAKGY